jgi:hypothetical protein
MFIQYDKVKILSLNREFSIEEILTGSRVPQIGDVASIVEVYTNPNKACELERIFMSGDTAWRATFELNDAQLELVSMPKI